MQSAPAIAVNKFSLKYQHHNLFDALDFVLPAEKCSCLLGPSGVGKSSILRFVAGLTNDQIITNSGSIKASDGRSLKNRVAHMAQQDSLMPWLSSLENVMIGARLRGEKITPAHKKQALTLLEKVGLAQATDLLPDKLSGGMRQRVALARTLFEDKQIVLMDEPFSSLDAITRMKLQELAVELLQKRTVLLVTHDPLEALRIADYIYVMTGSPAKINLAIEPREKTPRDLADPELMKQYARLLKLL